MNMLFLYTGNSCRLILPKATFNHLAPAGWKAMSAGSKPAGQVHLRSLVPLAREGIPTGVIGAWRTRHTQLEQTLKSMRRS